MDPMSLKNLYYVIKIIVIYIFVISEGRDTLIQNAHKKEQTDFMATTSLPVSVNQCV